jgi:hypothetical protein
VLLLVAREQPLVTKSPTHKFVARCGRCSSGLERMAFTRHQSGGLRSSGLRSCEPRPLAKTIGRLWAVSGASCRKNLIGLRERSPAGRPIRSTPGRINKK